MICTRNRDRQLQSCLARVREIQAPRSGWELVVVDNGSSDGTPAVIEDFRRAAPCRVTVVSQPIEGLSLTRNAAIEHARGEIIASIDDDCYIAPDCLVQIETIFASADIGYLGGRVMLYDPTDDPITTQTRSHAVVLEPLSFVPPGFIHGANMAFRRDMAVAIGGFDLGFGAGTALFAGEDTEFFGRASALGWRGVYDPRPVVHHHHGRKPGRDVQRLMKRYDYARGGYYARCLTLPALRGSCLRHVYRELKANVRRSDFGAIVREVTGMICFFLYRPRRAPSELALAAIQGG